MERHHLHVPIMSAQAVQTLLFSIAALLAALTLALNAYTSQQLFWVVNALYRDADCKSWPSTNPSLPVHVPH